MYASLCVYIYIYIYIYIYMYIYIHTNFFKPVSECSESATPR